MQQDELSDLRELDLPFDVDNVIPQCHECVRNQIKKYGKFVEDDKTIGRQFLVPCKGIKKNIVSPMELATKTDDQIKYIKAVRDIVEFAKLFVRLPGNKPWIARWYQEQVLKCTSRRKVLRIGRRSGKTDSVCIEILFKLFTNENRRIFVTGPQKIHVEEIFTRIRGFIAANPLLQDSVLRDRSAPYYEIKMHNGSRLRGVPAGAKGKKEGLAGRGQDADDIYIEEMDYVDETALRGGILPILFTTPSVSLIGFSTPSGFKTPYYGLCEESPRYKEFHFTYKVLPWWREIEAEKPQFTEEEWKHEYCFTGDQEVLVLDKDNNTTNKFIKDISTGDRVYSSQDNKFVNVKQIFQNSVRDVLCIKTDIGNIKCTKDHGFRNLNTMDKAPIDSLNRIPVGYIPKYLYNSSSKERLARLVGFINGDGYIATLPTRYSARFYGEKIDLENIAYDIYMLYGIKYTPRFKSSSTNSETYIVEVNKDISNDLIKHGALIGKKTTQKNTVPKWIANSAINIQKEFFGGLWGAEGSTIRSASEKAYVAHSLTLSMTLMSNEILYKFQELLKKYSINSTVVDNVIYIKDDNDIQKFVNIDLIRYCHNKEILSFFFSLYFKERNRLYYDNFKKHRQIQKELNRNAVSLVSILKKYNVTKKSFYSWKDTFYKKGYKKYGQIKTYIPKLNDWLYDYVINNLCFIQATDKQLIPSQPTFNIEVDSSDHSYLLANYIETFNCAEWGTAEAGVYKPSYIDRALIDYKYDDIIRNPGWKYTIGTDWNEKHGTEIVVLGFNPFTNRFQVVDSLHVEASEFTQLTGVSKLLEMNRKWRPHFIYIDAGNGCLAKDSLVYTDNGLKEIKDIISGDNVLSHNGEFKRVLTAVNTGQKKSYSFKPAFCLKTIVSDKHKHIVYRSKNKFHDFFWVTPTSCVPKSSIEFKELKTEELDKDKDFILVPKQKITNKKYLIVDLADELKDIPNIEYDENYIWNTNSYNTSPKLPTKDIVKKYNTSRATVQRVKRKIKNGRDFTRSEKILAKQLRRDYGDNWYVLEHKKISRYINILDQDFLNLYGWYLSEGHAGVNNIEISQMPFHYKEEFNNLVSYCSKNWDINLIIRKNGMKRLFILSSLLTEFFKRIGGSHCYNKFIDQRIINNNGYQLLPSLFWGDGHEHKHGINISLTSYTLVMQVRQMLINNGILSGIHKIKPRKRKDGYKDTAQQLMLYINANKTNVDKINNILNTHIKTRDGIFRRKYIELRDCFLVPIKKLVDIGVQENMYDLTVDEDSSFCVNGFATHNSTNYEILRKTAYDNMRRNGDRDTANLLNILKKYDAGASIEIRDPVSSQKKKAPAKPFMVNSSVRLFEQDKIRISNYDHILEKQLRNYIIDRITATKIPVYGLEDDRVKDHRLDALNLAIVAFHLEFDSLHVRNVNTQVVAVPDPRTFKDPASPDKHKAKERYTTPQERRLDGGFQKTLAEEQLFAMTPARIDSGDGLDGIKTNRPGWATDEEDKYIQRFLQRRRGRQTIRRDRPSRSNF